MYASLKKKYFSFMVLIVYFYTLAFISRLIFVLFIDEEISSMFICCSFHLCAVEHS